MIKTILKNIVFFIISVICMSVVMNVVPDGYWPSAISLLMLSVNYFIWGLCQ